MEEKKKQGGKRYKPDGSIAQGRKKLADPKVQITCYFYKSDVEKLGRDRCRKVAEEAVHNESTADGLNKLCEQISKEM